MHLNKPSAAAYCAVYATYKPHAHAILAWLFDFHVLGARTTTRIIYRHTKYPPWPLEEIKHVRFGVAGLEGMRVDLGLFLCAFPMFESRWTCIRFGNVVLCPCTCPDVARDAAHAVL